MSWKCGTCGQVHDGAPDSYGFDTPWHWNVQMMGKEGCFFLPDYCAIDNRDFFIRGVIEIPIVGRDQPFAWGVWTTLSKDNLNREMELADDPRRVHEPPYFGWLANRINIYPDTLLLKTHVHTREVGKRPAVELEPTNHPLAVEQRNGITMERVRQIAELVVHGWKHPEWMSGKNVPQ